MSHNSEILESQRLMYFPRESLCLLLLLACFFCCFCFMWNISWRDLEANIQISASKQQSRLVPAKRQELEGGGEKEGLSFYFGCMKLGGGRNQKNAVEAKTWGRSGLSFPSQKEWTIHLVWFFSLDEGTRGSQEMGKGVLAIGMKWLENLRRGEIKWESRGRAMPCMP